MPRRMGRRRRLLRILVNTSAATSLTLCMGTLGLWLRGRSTIDLITITDAREYRLRSENGFVLLTVQADYAGAPALERVRSWSARRFIGHLSVPMASGGPRLAPMPRYTRYDQPGMARYTKSLTVPDYHEFRRVYRLYLPLWLPSLAFAALPTLRLIVMVRAWRASEVGRCPACGYDLRATPDRCPECGTVPTAPPLR
jgi:hypothetical protein